MIDFNVSTLHGTLAAVSASLPCGEPDAHVPLATHEFIVAGKCDLSVRCAQLERDRVSVVVDLEQALEHPLSLSAAGSYVRFVRVQDHPYDFSETWSMAARVSGVTVECEQYTAERYRRALGASAAAVTHTQHCFLGDSHMQVASGVFVHFLKIRRRRFRRFEYGLDTTNATSAKSFARYVGICDVLQVNVGLWPTGIESWEQQTHRTWWPPEYAQAMRETLDFLRDAVHANATVVWIDTDAQPWKRNAANKCPPSCITHDGFVDSLNAAADAVIDNINARRLALGQRGVLRVHTHTATAMLFDLAKDWNHLKDRALSLYVRVRLQSLMRAGVPGLAATPA